MQVRYCIDPEAGQSHIYRHDVAESEVEEVLSRPGEDRAGSDGSRVATGRTGAGRLLRVIYVPDPRAEKCICHHGLRTSGRTRIGLSAAQAQTRLVSENRFPPGWDEKPVKGVVTHYESQSED